MPGRPRKPTALRILQGNPGKRPLPKDEPKPPVGCEPPAGMSKRALEYWRRIVPGLIEQGVATEMDPYALRRLCELEVACDRRARRGEASPSLLRLLLSFYQQFGMTASSRAKIVAQPQKPRSKLAGFTGGA